MGNFATGDYRPAYPAKYVGKHPIRYRSSWELAAMKYFDSGNPAILGWASETITIPYRNPLTGKPSLYVPDFLVIYLDKNNKQHCELMEIKPEKEMPGYPGKVPPRTRLIQAINAAKWQAAAAYCAKRNWVFRVVHEKQLFAFQRTR